jgi:hypothetical protein
VNRRRRRRGNQLAFHQWQQEATLQGVDGNANVMFWFNFALQFFDVVLSLMF